MRSRLCSLYRRDQRGDADDVDDVDDAFEIVGQYKKLKDEPSHERFGGLEFAKFTFFLLLFLTAANAVTSLLECGPLICADPPTDYKLLEDFNKSG